MRTTRLALLLLAMLFVTASHAAKEYEVSGSLTNCAVSERGDSFLETCDLESVDDMLAGTWTFTYEIDDSSQGVIGVDEGESSGTFEYDPADVEVQQGDIVIVTGDGSWDGGGHRVVSSSGTLDDFWADAFIHERVRPAAGDGRAWLIGGFLTGEEQFIGLELQLGGAGREPGPPYALDGWIQPEESDEDSASLLLQRLTTAGIGLIALAIVGTPAVISGLKGRWWMGVLGFVAVVGWVVVLFTFTAEPSEEFQETAIFRVLEILLQIALPGGLLLLLVGALLRARPGSWWDRNRSKAFEDELT